MPRCVVAVVAAVCLALPAPSARAGAPEHSVRPAPRAAAPSGPLCATTGITGRVLAPIAGRLQGCGVSHPVAVSAVEGVALSEAATLDCTTARALQVWVRDGLKPAIGQRGGGIAELRVIAHYACRTRNSLPGAKISEHGRGRAIDIAAIRLRDGYEYTVLTGWDDRRDGPVLHAAHRAACGIFTTVLGPDADRHHRDHFHLDTAPRRSGPFCQ